MYPYAKMNHCPLFQGPSCPTANRDNWDSFLTAPNSQGYQCVAAATSPDTNPSVFVGCPLGKVISAFDKDQTAAKGYNSFGPAASVGDVLSWNCGQFWEEGSGQFVLLKYYNSKHLTSILFHFFLILYL